MSTADEFLSLFDDEGRYKNADGEVEVVFLTQGGTRYPGKLRFRSGLLVRADMDGARPWAHNDESPLNGLKFLLYFPGEKPRAVFVEQGRIAHQFEMENQVSKEKFLSHLRASRNLFVHSGAGGDNSTTDLSSPSEALTRGALWLTPRSVEGFHAEDFPELGLDRRAKLAEAVRKFESVANRVPADEAPTREQYDEAASAFRPILDILGPYLPTAEESRKVERALRNVRFPSWVLNWDYELGTTEEGEAAVWVSIFTEGGVARSDYARFGLSVIPMIREALAAEEIQRWPYVRIRTAVEYKTA